MPEEIKERRMKSLNEMFGDIQNSNSETVGKNAVNVIESENIVELAVGDCVPYHNHKFIIKRSNYKEFVESIKTFGIINPIIVRPYKGKYEIIAGHRRHQGAIDAGLCKIPTIVKNLNDNEAWLIVSETNIQQSSLADMKHSERAEVLHDYHEALKAQGKRTDMINEVKNLLENTENKDLETSRLLGEKLNSTEETGKGFSLSSRTVSRYLRIFLLIDEIKCLIDEEKIPLYAGVELSYLTKDNQIYLSSILNNSNYKVDIKKAETIREYQKKGKLTQETIKEILISSIQPKGKKLDSKGFKPMSKIYNKYFTNQQNQKEIEEVIDQALALYFSRNNDGENE